MTEKEEDEILDVLNHSNQFNRWDEVLGYIAKKKKEWQAEQSKSDGESFARLAMNMTEGDIWRFNNGFAPNPDKQTSTKKPSERINDIYSKKDTSSYRFGSAATAHIFIQSILQFLDEQYGK